MRVLHDCLKKRKVGLAMSQSHNQSGQLLTSSISALIFLSMVVMWNTPINKVKANSIYVASRVKI